MSSVHYEQNNHIGVITIDAPPVNALNRDVINGLEEAIARVEGDTRVIIIRGAGTKAFVAGADIKEFPYLTAESGENLCLRGQSVFNALSNLKQPVIAAIDGFALGGGLELALACDIRIATKRSQLGLPEVKLGIIPGYGGTQRLPRLIGMGKAMQLIFTGEFLSAEEALKHGLIEEIVEVDAMSRALELAGLMASRGPVALEQAKKAVTKGMDISLSEGLKFEAKLFGELCNTDDKTEGVTAFLEKREPQFVGK